MFVILPSLSLHTSVVMGGWYKFLISVKFPCILFHIWLTGLRSWCREQFSCLGVGTKYPHPLSNILPDLIDLRRTGEPCIRVTPRWQIVSTHWIAYSKIVTSRGWMMRISSNAKIIMVLLETVGLSVLVANIVGKSENLSGIKNVSRDIIDTVLVEAKLQSKLLATHSTRV